ncbi:hypothetical protein [Flavobacterium sp.]|uniref:hypothetical protein n=1 Tax=Flavobacterium sp. TaxID=239 RepID=UPI0039E5992C
MKKIVFLFTSFLLLSCASKANSQQSLNDNQIASFKERLQAVTENLEKLNRLNLAKEDPLTFNILNNKAKAEEFAATVLKLTFKDISKLEPISFEVEEDKSTKLWFVYCKFSHSITESEYYFIISKNTCEVYYMSSRAYQHMLKKN